MEISKLPSTEFEEMVVRMLSELQSGIEELTENFNKELKSVINSQANLKIQRMSSREDGSSPFPSISSKGSNYFGHPQNLVLPSYKYSHIVCFLYLNSSNSS